MASLFIIIVIVIIIIIVIVIKLSSLTDMQTNLNNPNQKQINKNKPEPIQRRFASLERLEEVSGKACQQSEWTLYASLKVFSSKYVVISSTL